MRAPQVAVACMWVAALSISGCGWGRNNRNLGNFPVAGVGQPAPPPTLGQMIGSAFKKTGEALTLKPKVTPAKDPTQLSYRPASVSPDVYTQAAQLLEQKGDVNAAIGQYEKALSVAPKDMKALLGLARLYDRQENFTKATETYMRAAEAHPGNGVVLNDLGLCYARQRNWERSLDALSRAVDADPSSKLYRNNLATILMERGQPAEALRQFAAVHGEPVAYYNVGLLLYKKGDQAAAVSYLRRAVQLDPSLQAAQTLLARLQPTSAPEARPAGYSASLPAQYPPRVAQQPPQNYAPVVSPSDLAPQSGAGTATAPQFADVQVPQMSQYAVGGEAQTPPTPDQYGSLYQPTAFPRSLPPVE